MMKTKKIVDFERGLVQCYDGSMTTGEAADLATRMLTHAIEEIRRLETENSQLRNRQAA